MKHNQLSKFDCRNLFFNPENNLLVKYTERDFDLQLYRNGKYVIFNNEEIKVETSPTRFVITKEVNGCQKTRTFTLSSLIRYTHYGNEKLCYHKCDCNCD